LLRLDPAAGYSLFPLGLNSIVTLPTLVPVAGPATIHTWSKVHYAVRTTGKLGCSATASPRPTRFVRTKKFVAFLWQIAPIVPVLPTPPMYKPFAVNKMPAKRYLDIITVKDRQSWPPVLLLISAPLRTGVLQASQLPG